MGNTTLMIVQAVCFTVTLMLALVLVMSRVHVKTICRSYETARWFLFSAMVLFAIHYLLQMIFGFRAQGADVGAVVNILFYSPIAFLIVYSTIRMGSGTRYLRQYCIIGIASMVLIMIVFVSGYLYYRSLHMPWALYTMMTLHALTRIFFVFHPYGELRRVRRKVENETSGDIQDYDLYMNTGTTVLYATSLLTVVSIISTRAIVFLGIFVFLALTFYVVSFVSLGANVTTVKEVIDDDELIDASISAAEERQDSAVEVSSEFVKHPLTAEQIAMVEASIERWQSDRGFNVQNLTSASVAQRMGISKRLLSQYLSQERGTSFRMWLSDLRIEETKRLLLTEPSFSVEAIAELCGFSSRSWMTEKFKASTGMTPADWRETNKA